MMPWTTIEWALRFIVLLIEGIPAEQRRATAIIWFWMWWPLGKLFVAPEHQQQILDIMNTIGKDPAK